FAVNEFGWIDDSTRQAGSVSGQLFHNVFTKIIPLQFLSRLPASQMGPVIR
ncbi:hypothetical protein LCGC14_3098970, partial [marine sediment metagenome]